jgi:hypothetical protein
VAVLIVALGLARPGHGANFACAAGDVTCLITAMNTANANGQANTITLAAGTYTLTTIHNTTDGPNGLPSVISTLTITGEDAATTIIARDASASAFRLVHVAASGTLTIKGLTLHGGRAGPNEGGGLFNNGGMVTLTGTTVANNRAIEGGGLATVGGIVSLSHAIVTSNITDGPFNGGGLWSNGGTVSIMTSTFVDNDAGAGGGLFNIDGTMTITTTTIADNRSDLGGGFYNTGTLTLTRSTIASNGAIDGGGGLSNAGGSVMINDTTFNDNIGDAGGGGVLNVDGTVTILNSTIARNMTGTLRGPGGGLYNRSGTITMQNTILALNTIQALPPSPDCTGPVTSLGNNLIGDPSGCTITLQDTDRTGDPSLDPYTDTGQPGRGHFPLLPTSPAIDAGNDAVCPETDQLGKERVGTCDIGAVEFQLTNAMELTTLSPAIVWIGLKNSDDQGTSFDLRAEVYLHATLVAAGLTRCIMGVTRNPHKAKEVMVPFGSIADGILDSGDIMSLKVLTRIGTKPDGTRCAGHSNAVGLRLYYDAATRASRFGAELTPEPLTDFFLHSTSGSDYLDETTPTASTAQFKESAAVNFKNGNPWQAIGTWSTMLP